MSVFRLLFVLTVCALLLPALPAAAENDKMPRAGEPEIILTFLGTGAPRPSAERFGPAILVETDKHRILVDAGSLMRERLFAARGFTGITGVDHVLVSHLHFDHTVSIPDLWLSGWLYGRRVPLLVHGPAGTEAMMEHFMRAYDWDVEYRALVGVPRPGSTIEAHDIGPGLFYEKDGLKITAFEVEHMPIDVETGERLDFPGATLGFRIDYKGRSVVFSGDTRSTMTSKLLEYGRGADVLVHEVQVPSPGMSEEAKLANVSLSVHSTPEQAARIFKHTEPGLAVYSHIIPPGTTAKQLIDATRPIYAGPLSVAHDLMMITVGEEITVGESPRRGDEIFEESGVLK